RDFRERSGSGVQGSKFAPKPLSVDGCRSGRRRKAGDWSQEAQNAQAAHCISSFVQPEWCCGVMAIDVPKSTALRQSCRGKFRIWAVIATICIGLDIGRHHRAVFGAWSLIAQAFSLNMNA